MRGVGDRLLQSPGFTTEDVPAARRGKHRNDIEAADILHDSALNVRSSSCLDSFPINLLGRSLRMKKK